MKGKGPGSSAPTLRLKEGIDVQKHQLSPRASMSIILVDRSPMHDHPLDDSREAERGKFKLRINYPGSKLRISIIVHMTYQSGETQGLATRLLSARMCPMESVCIAACTLCEKIWWEEIKICVQIYIKKEIQQVESKKKLQQAVEGAQTKRIMHQMKKDHQGS